MDVNEIRSYEDLQAFLRTFKTMSDSPLYDFNGVVHLLIAIIENINENALDEQIEEMADSFTPEQLGMLSRILRLSKIRPG